MKNTKYFKRIMSAGLAALMLVTASGCSKKDEGKTVTLWMNTGSAKAYWKEKIENFNNTRGKELGVTLKFDAKVDSNYGQALDVAIQSDQLPDFFSDGDLVKMVELGRVVAFEDLPGMEEMIADTKEYMVPNYHSYEGKTYALPNGMTTRGLVYNKDMFREAGIVDENGEPTPPKTLAEMREMAKKLTDESKNQYGIVFPVKWTSWVDSDIVTLAMPSFGTQGYDPVTGTYDYSIFEPIIQNIMDMKADGSVYPGAEGLDNDPARARFAEGGIGMKIAYSFDCGVFNEQFKAKCDWGVAPLPVYDADKCYKQPAGAGATMRISKHAIENIGEELTVEIFKTLYGKETTREMYERGLSIPTNWDDVSDIELGEDTANGWKEFCELAAISTGSPLAMPTDTQGKESFKEAMINKIWPETGNIAEILKEKTEILNEGIKAYQATYPDKDYSIYIDKDWNNKVKRG